MKGAGLPSVDICVCTYRRAHLADTLASIGRIAARRFEVRVLVADNEETPAERRLVERIRHNYRFPLLYLHAPAANISVARNAWLEAVRADFVAFVDDDELVSEAWLDELVATAGLTGADVVLGPVQAVYAPGTPHWMVRGDFHSTAPVLAKGSIRTGYTCNVLVRWSGPVTRLRFDPALGRTGGEDTDFFHRIHDLGGRIVAAPGAIVYEPVPVERARLGWLLRRRLRFGQTHGIYLARAREGGPAGWLLAAAKAGCCLLLTLFTLPAPVLRYRNLLRMTLHLGVLGGLLGARPSAHYGHEPAPAPPRLWT